MCPRGWNEYDHTDDHDEYYQDQLGDNEMYIPET